MLDVYDHQHLKTSTFYYQTEMSSDTFHFLQFVKAFMQTNIKIRKLMAEQSNNL